jgi:Uma2 family endonuclease
MSTVVSELNEISIVDFLNRGNGRTILLTGVSWPEYEQFLRDFWENTNLSFAYNDGKLEILTKSLTHENYSRSIYNLVLVYCEHFDIDIEGRGSATFKRSEFEKGVEPDECFYLKNVEKVIGLNQIDLEEYPLPDIAVEIDITTDSLDKFPIYAALEVPELWVFDGTTMKFYELSGKSYNQIEKSCALPLLSANLLTEFLVLNHEKGQTAALKEFRRWLNEHLSDNPKS